MIGVIPSRDAVRNDISGFQHLSPPPLTSDSTPVTSQTPIRSLYYGWVIASALAITETISWGILYYAFSVFLVPMETDLQATRAELSASFSLALLVSAVGAVPVGRWLDKHGARGLMTLGSIAATGLLVAWSQVSSVWQLYGVMMGLGLMMAFLLYDTAFSVVTVWFARHRRRALTLITLMAGLASTIFLPLSNWLLELQGWRGALLSLALILGAITIPLHALVLRRRPHDLGLPVDGLPPETTPTHANSNPPLVSIPPAIVIKSASFWLLILAFVLNFGASVAVGVHFIPYLLGQNYGGAFAAGVAGLVGLMQLPGRMLYEPLTRAIAGAARALKLPALNYALTPMVMAAQGGAVMLLLLSSSTMSVVAFAVLFGMANGILTLARAECVALFYGVAHYASLNGVISFWTTLARALGPTLMAGLYLSWGGYNAPFELMLVLMVVGGAAYALAETQAMRKGSSH